MNTVTHIDCCECPTCRAHKLAKQGQEFGDRLWHLLRRADLFKALYPEPNIIVFPVHRTRGFGGIHEPV